MTFEEKLLAGILIGIVVWFITKTATYFLTKYTIEAGLLTDIGLQVKSIKESNEYLDQWLPTLKAGTEIGYTARHNADSYIYFHSLLPELPKYFSRKTFTKILRYYKCIEEYEVLLDGFFLDVSEWLEVKKIITEDDITYLTRKKIRIQALSKILISSNYSALKNLPIDYEGKLHPSTIIMK